MAVRTQTQSFVSTSTLTPSSSSSSNNNSSYKRPRALVPELPLTVAWLEHTTLEMTSEAFKGHTQYVCHVSYRETADSKPLSWQLSRSFEDYADFRKRLIKILAFGHSCSAECKWLHSFAKKYFPGKALFANSCTALMIVRREKLNRFMNVLRSSLLNRGNHGCGHLVNNLAIEFSKFIEGDNRLAKYNKDAPQEDTATERGQRWSVNSSVSTTSTDASDYHDDSQISELAPVCDLCKGSLDGSPSSVRRRSSCDTTTLSCGHQFHDGCVLPQLESLEFCCPTCHESQL